MNVRTRIYDWLDHEFVAVSGEGKPAGTVAEETQELFGRLDGELRKFGLSLENTVRTRLWARDRPSRDQGSAERVKALSGRARSASSSFIAPDFFASEARVGLELWAMRPGGGDAEKTLVEYDPPIVPVRYIRYDSVIFLSGVTAVLPTLQEQVADIIPRIEESLEDAGTSWDRVARIACLLHRSQTVADLRAIWPKSATAPSAQFDFGFADGYSSEGKLIEIEVTSRA
jgi:enamine deaminase RidA (YjgF/YER057c/UK114 family)